MGESDALEGVFVADKVRRRGCPVCGSVNAVQVHLRITETDEHGNVVAGKSRSRSFSRSLCPEHGAHAYMSLQATFRKLLERRRGS